MFIGAVSYRYIIEEVSPRVWFSLEDQTHWQSPEKDPSFWTISKQLSKQFSDVAVTVLLPRLFQMLMSLSLKKWCLKSSRDLFLPHVRLLVEYSKKVLKFTDENPWIILNTSMRSALIRLSSNDHKLSFCNLVSYGRCLTDGIILVNLFCICSTSVTTWDQATTQQVYSTRGLTRDFLQWKQYVGMSICRSFGL